jgi:hypothetical protein
MNRERLGAATGLVGHNQRRLLQICRTRKGSIRRSAQEAFPDRVDRVRPLPNPMFVFLGFVAELTHPFGL